MKYTIELIVNGQTVFIDRLDHTKIDKIVDYIGNVDEELAPLEKTVVLG